MCRIHEQPLAYPRERQKEGGRGGGREGRNDGGREGER